MERLLIEDSINLIGKRVKIAGWVKTRRDHGRLIFIDIFDASGLLQVVFSPENKELLKTADNLRTADVVEISGFIQKRPEKMVNPNLSSGEVELQADDLKILNKSATPPFELFNSGYEIGEEHRLKYRYLDLRRPRLQNNLKLRHKFFNFIRNYLSKKNFIEIETPLLTKSTPEGARDFVVPSRLHPGKFYALPQSPQQYKQLLMVAGFERYFQIARCIRDEDTRGDRQPEFTQLDIEVSFASQDEIMSLVEDLIFNFLKKNFSQRKVNNIPWPRISYQESLKKFGSDCPDLRQDKKSDELNFCWIVDFPAFEKKEGKWSAVHHPFTLPQTEDIVEIKNSPGKILAYQYDLVLNGEEVGGGSLRIYKPELLKAVFELLGHSQEEIKNQFGHLLEAFNFGAPPHGGVALGLDRILMIFCGEPSIREVIAFPKTGDGRDLMMDAPSELKPSQLKELNLKIDFPNS